MLSHVHRHRGSRNVDVIRRAHRDRVTLFAHLLEHLAEVSVWLGSLKSILRSFELIGIDVGNCHNLAAATGVRRVTLPLAANPNASKTNFLIGADGLVVCGGRPRGDPVPSSNGRGHRKEIATRR